MQCPLCLDFDKCFAFGVIVVMICFCTWCNCCVDFFHFGLITCLHIRTCYFLRGCVFFQLVTHTPSLQGFCADANRFALKCWWLVGGVGVGGTNQPTHHATHPANQLPTNSHPPTHSHPATMQGFCADVHCLTMESIPRLLLEHSKYRITVDAVP